MSYGDAINRAHSFAGIWEAIRCFVGLHCELVPLRRGMTRAERRRPHRRGLNIGVGRYGEACGRCGKVVAGQEEPPRMGAL